MRITEETKHALQVIGQARKEQLISTEDKHDLMAEQLRYRLRHREDPQSPEGRLYKIGIVILQGIIDAMNHLDKEGIPYK